MANRLLVLSGFVRRAAAVDISSGRSWTVDRLRQVAWRGDCLSTPYASLGRAGRGVYRRMQPAISATVTQLTFSDRRNATQRLTLLLCWAPGWPDASGLLTLAGLPRARVAWVSRFGQQALTLTALGRSPG